MFSTEYHVKALSAKLAHIFCGEFLQFICSAFLSLSVLLSCLLTAYVVLAVDYFGS